MAGSHPTSSSDAKVVAVALAAAFTAAWAIAAVARGRAPVWIAYDVPIAFPFALFVIERMRGREEGLAERAIDAFVVGVALLRVIPGVPGYSGHVLFLGYAALRARTIPLRAAAWLVLLEVLVIKVALFRDLVTPAGSIVLLALALALRRAALGRASRPPR